MTQDVYTSTADTTPIRSWPAPDFTDVPRFSREPAARGDVTCLAAAFASRGAHAQQIMDGLVAGPLLGGPSAGFVERLRAPSPIAATCDAVGVPPAPREGMRERTRLTLSSSQSAETSTSVFSHPDRIDSDRQPNPAVSSGYPPQLSVGALLDRLESKVVVGAALGHFPGNRLSVPPAEVLWRKGALTRRAQALPTASGTSGKPAT